MTSIPLTHTVASIKAAHYFIDYLLKGGMNEIDVAHALKCSVKKVNKLHARESKRVPLKIFDNLIIVWCRTILKEGQK